MGLILVERQALLVDFAGDALYAFMATAYPGDTATISNEASGGSPAYARIALVWSAPDVNGIITATADVLVPAGNYRFAGVASGLTGANQKGNWPITADYSVQSTHRLNFTARLP